MKNTMSEKAKEIRAKVLEGASEQLMTLLYQDEEALKFLNAACQWSSEQDNCHILFN